jgi:uncharacterized DUF497 family protein
MALQYDPRKNAANIAKRGLPFDRVNDLEWRTSIVRQDIRRDWGEMRLLVMAKLDGKLHAAVVTPRGDDLRVISFRRAHRKEEKEYDQHQAAQSQGRG